MTEPDEQDLTKESAEECITDCGWCFTETKPLKDTHPADNGWVGCVCPNCLRVYLWSPGTTRRADVK